MAARRAGGHRAQQMQSSSLGASSDMRGIIHQMPFGVGLGWLRSMRTEPLLSIWRAQNSITKCGKGMASQSSCGTPI